MSREDWRAAVHGVAESEDSATKQQQITLDKRATAYSHQKQPIDSH